MDASPLGKLLPELRDHIYMQHLQSEEVMVDMFNTAPCVRISPSPKHLLALPRVCRQVRQECLLLVPDLSAFCAGAAETRRFNGPATDSPKSFRYRLGAWSRDCGKWLRSVDGALRSRVRSINIDLGRVDFDNTSCHQYHVACSSLVAGFPVYAAEHSSECYITIEAASNSIARFIRIPLSTNSGALDAVAESTLPLRQLFILRKAEGQTSSRELALHSAHIVRCSRAIPDMIEGLFSNKQYACDLLQDDNYLRGDCLIEWI